MAKKFSLLMAAVAVLALVIPALAKAAPSITSSKGALAKASTETKNASTLTLTSTNVTWTSSLGVWRCERFQMSAWLTKNTGTEVDATHDEGETNKANNCTAGGTPIAVTDPTITTLQANILGSGTKTVSIDFTWPEVGCTFTGTLPFTYTAGGSSIHVAGSVTSNPCGKMTMEGDFTVEIATTAVILD